MMMGIHLWTQGDKADHEPPHPNVVPESVTGVVFELPMPPQGFKWVQASYLLEQRTENRGPLLGLKWELAPV